jgi:magnesium transporter
MFCYLIEKRGFEMFVTEKLKTFSWVNVGNPDHDDFERLQSEYKIDEDNIIDILDPDEQPRLEIEDDYKVIIVRFPIINRENDTLWHTEPLSIIYSTNRVITVCRKRCDLLDKIKKDEKTSREDFVLNILYYIAESYLRLLKELNKRVLESKKGLQKYISKYDLMALLEVENSYTLYMAGIKGNVSVLDKLEKMRGFIKTDEAQELAEDVRIEFGQATEVVTSYSKMLKSIKETFESIINMESNRYINRLTMWNIILVIPTVIVGYYGMNVALPFAESQYAATGIFVVILLLLVGFAIFGFIKSKK